MTILAINGSPRPKGNTSIMLGWALEELNNEGFKTEIVQLGGIPVRGCKACWACGKKKDLTCSIDDEINPIIKKMAEAEAIIFGSPVYFADITPEIKSLIDRAGLVLKNSGNPVRRKPGAAVVVARRAGHVHSYDSINHFFGIMEMYTVGSSYWNLGVAREEGQINEDAEAKDTMKNLGQNMAWILKKINSVKST